MAMTGIYFLGWLFLDYHKFVCATQVSPEEVPSASLKCVFTW